jgi:hypothetical protein
MSPTAVCERIPWLPRDRGPFGRAFLFAASALLLGLLVPGGLNGQPPAKNGNEPPLFLDPAQVQGPALATSILTGSNTPGVGPWILLGNLHVGAHPDLQIWDLETLMSSRPGRQAVGASTLFLSGFGDTRQTTLSQFALFQAGEKAQSWTLFNTSKVRLFPEAFRQLGYIQDRQRIEVGTPEAQAYAHILVMAHYTTARAFWQASRDDLTYTHLFQDPDKHRGEVVRVSGRLRLIRRYDPPPEARAEGVNDLYEAWVFDEQGVNPFVVVFSVWPEGLSRDLLTRDKVHPPVPVKFAGYFFKRYRYKARDSTENTARDAPLVIGRTLEVEQSPSGTSTTNIWPNLFSMVTTIAVGVAIVMAVLGGMVYWFRRSDARYQQKLHTLSRPQEFVPPPTEAPPLATPIARENIQHGPSNRPRRDSKEGMRDEG